MNNRLFSIVVPVYYNELNLPDTIPALLALGEQLPDYRLELIFVDDGSQDRSLNVLLDFQSQHPETIRVVKLTRNFGSMAAIQAGFTVARGDCVGMITADLQDPPELFIEMIRYWEKGIKAVFAVRSDRQESRSQRWFASLYYQMLRKFAVPNYPEGGFDYLLVDRQVVDDVNRIQEKNTNLMTLIFWLGYESMLIPYVRRARQKGKSRWTLRKKVKLFVDTFISFSFFPIRLLSVVGLLLAFGAIAYGIFIFFAWLFFGIEVKGWVPIMLALTIPSGFQMLMLGILGEYLWRMLDETRRRPMYVIDQVYDRAENPVINPVQEQA